MSPKELEDIMFHSEKFNLFYKDTLTPNHLFMRIYHRLQSGEYLSPAVYIGRYNENDDIYWFEKECDCQEKIVDSGELSKYFETNLRIWNAEILIPL